MKRLICIALLLALAVCAVAEEDLTLDMPAAEDIAIESDAFPEDAPVEIAQEEDLLLPEDIDLELSSGNLEPEAEGRSANAAEANGAVANTEIRVTDWNDLIDEVNSAADGDTILIGGPIRQKLGKGPIRITKNLTLNVHENTIVSENYAKVLFKSSCGGWTITGNHFGKIKDCGTAVRVSSGAFTMAGDFTFQGCYNYAVDNNGRFTMTGGSIVDCGKEHGDGYGVYNTGEFIMTGGSITGNKEGVVTDGSKTALTVSGYVKITGNTEYDVLLQKGQVVAVGGELHEKARIGITLFDDNLPAVDKPVVATRGLKGNGTADNFVVWGDYEKRINDDGELEVCVAPSLPAAADYTLLAKLKASGKKALKLSWTKVEGADGYDVFYGKCGDSVKRKTVTGGTGCKLTGLKKAATYRAYVKAWEKAGGKKRYIGEASPTVSAITGGYTKSRCNPKAVTVKKPALSLKVGKTAAIKATVKGVKAHREVLSRGGLVRFYSSDVNVAAVNGSGKVTAMGPGKCTIWVLASNGVRASVKVRVK